MYAVIKNGAHQYRIKPGEFLRLEKLPLSPGKIWKCQNILAFQDGAGQFTVGSPYIKKAEVWTRVVRHGKAKKVLVFKKNRRKGYRRTKGHRQEFTEIYVEAFYTPEGKKISATKRKSPVASKEKDSTKKTSTKTVNTKKTSTEKVSKAQSKTQKPSIEKTKAKKESAKKTQKPSPKKAVSSTVKSKKASAVQSQSLKKTVGAGKKKGS